MKRISLFNTIILNRRGGESSILGIYSQRNTIVSTNQIKVESCLSCQIEINLNSKKIANTRILKDHYPGASHSSGIIQIGSRPVYYSINNKSCIRILASLILGKNALGVISKNVLMNHAPYHNSIFLENIKIPENNNGINNIYFNNIGKAFNSLVLT